MSFVPMRLKELRILNGFTLEDVAAKIGVTKQAVSKYEGGKAVPATDVIARILREFDINRNYLTNERELPEEKSIIFFRKKARTPKKEEEEAEVYLKRFYEIITVAGQIYPVKKTGLPVFPEDMSINNKALMLRDFWGLGKEPIEDIIGLLEAHGFYMFTADMQNKKVDGYSQLIGNIPVIVLNEKSGTEARNHFSIAHELGHLILHKNLEESCSAMEAEADEFAGCFLMPEDAMKADLIRRDASYFVSLAEKWKVSPQAVAQRYANLRLLGRNKEENQAKLASLHQHFSKEKGKKIYNDERIICSIRAALKRIEADNGTAQRFLQELRLPVKEIQRLCYWPNGFSEYEQSVSEAVNDIDGAQLSFDF